MSSNGHRRIFYLARHGETSWNLAGRWQGQTDIGLNDRGREQAQALAERLRGHGIARVRASDLLRARQTAEIVARVLGTGSVSIDPALRERSYGVFEGLTRDECAARHPVAWASYMADRTFSPPGAERQEDLVRRMREAMRRAHDEEAGDGAAVLVVSHGGAIRALLASATGTHPPPMDNGAILRLAMTAAGLEAVADD
jgi:probable phosphoglycerate mutase